MTENIELESLGWPTLDGNEFGTLVEGVLENGGVLSLRTGEFLILLQPNEHLQFWGQANADQVFQGLTPFFVGPSRSRVRVSRSVPRPERCLLDGDFVAGFTGGGADVPIVFTAPDFALSRTLSLPHEYDVALVAFPQEVRAFADEKTFRAGQDGPLRYASESFVPFGLSLAAGGTPSSVAKLSGRLERVGSFDNPWTGLTLPWVTVRTLGLTIDMPIAPSRLTGELVENGVVSAIAAIYGIIKPAAEGG